MFEKLKKTRKEVDVVRKDNIAKAKEMITEIRAMIEKIKAIRAGKVGVDELEDILRLAPLAPTSVETTADRQDDTERVGERTIAVVEGITPEGKEVRIEMAELARHWNKFYMDNGIDWIKPISEDIKLTVEQAKEMKRQIQELGFDWPMIIPAGLTGEPEFEAGADGKLELKKADRKYIDLHEKMSEGYAETYQSDNYKDDGGIGATKDKRKGIRIILTKEVQTLGEDELFKQTIGQSVEDLEAGIFKDNQAGGLTESEYLVYQREYYKRTGKHLDDWKKEQTLTWLPESGRPVSGCVPYASWDTDYGQMVFHSSATTYQHGDLGCRLVGS
ncbi:MAG: hypothetical protein Q8M92_02230, partial [Candidatus Subteraquimicrobiales bacterium]|nr:hypothetical protein [Candidatus Subteraquimicrobiales bacterium]